MKKITQSKHFVSNAANQRESENNSLSFLVGMLFKMAWPVWKRYEGDVPEPELEELEKHRRLAAWISSTRYAADQQRFKFAETA